MGELRRVLGILREEQESERQLSPQPGSVTWTPSFGAGPRRGLTVTYPTVGGLDALGSDVRLAIHRIVQEALTTRKP
jgi:hypothetical protein